MDLYLKQAIDHMEDFKVKHFIDYLKNEVFYDDLKVHVSVTEPSLRFIKHHRYTSFKFYQIRPKNSNKIIIKASYALYNNPIYSRYYFEDNLYSYLETFSLCSWNTNTTRSHLKLFNVSVKNKNYKPYFLDNKIYESDNYIITRNRNDYFNYDEMLDHFKNRNIEDITEEISDKFSNNQLNIIKSLAG